MTAREKLEAEEKKKRIYYMKGGTCEVCGKVIPYAEAQLAHRIAKTRPNIKKYGKNVINHPLNLALTCSDRFGRCNDACNIGNNPVKVAKLLGEILNDSL